MTEARTRQLTHDRLTDRFDELMDDYDVARRSDVLVNRFLGADAIAGRLVLDAGCGVGALTRALQARGAFLSPSTGIIDSAALLQSLEQEARERGVSLAFASTVQHIDAAGPLRVYGNTVAQTPVLDQFSREAVRFTRAYTVTPLTIPAHSSLFTGLYPPRHGVRDNLDYRLADSAVTLAERLHDSGYQTMATVGAEVTTRHWGFAQGFDSYFDDMGQDPGATIFTCD